MLPYPLLLRLARRLEAEAAGRMAKEPDAAWRAFDDAVAELGEARRRVRIVRDKKWTSIAPSLAAVLPELVDDVRRRAELLLAELTAPPSPAPGIGEWVREVRQLEEEFDTVEVRWADGTVRAATDPIELDGVDLGPFAVEFAWPRLGGRAGSACFRAVALEPNPAAGRPDVVHPHVDGTTPCLGDAKAPVDRAVAAGRLADAFLLVRSILTTYNPSSPYVPLAEWDGIACGECGRRADRDDASNCEGCETALCDDCAGSCGKCFQTRCGTCLGRCDGCRDRFCPGCLEEIGDRSLCEGCLVPCPGCSARTPRDELTAAGTCPACDPSETEDTPDDDTDAGDDAAADDAPADEVAAVVLRHVP